MALSASEITQSIKSQNKDPRVESDLELKFKQEAANPEFLKKLRGGIDYWHMLQIGDTEIPVRLLSVKETMDVMRATHNWFLSLSEIERLPDLWPKKRAILTLVRALSSTPDSEGDHKFFITEETLERLEDQVFVNLFRAYSDLCEEFDISLDKITREEYVSMLEDLKKNRALAKNLSRSRMEQMFFHLLDDSISLMDKLHMLHSQSDTSMTA